MHFEPIPPDHLRVHGEALDLALPSRSTAYAFGRHAGGVAYLDPGNGKIWADYGGARVALLGAIDAQSVPPLPPDDDRGWDRWAALARAVAGARIAP